MNFLRFASKRSLHMTHFTQARATSFEAGSDDRGERTSSGRTGELHSVGPQKSRELLVCIMLIRCPALSSARLRNRTNSLNGWIGPSANCQYAQCVRVGGRPRSASKI